MSLSPPSDNTDRPSNAPPPELNPLINPLLGQNMGRWAEVYFNSPPEKREEAVAQLLHELQTENSSGKDEDTSSVSSQDEASAPIPEESSAPIPGDISTENVSSDDLLGQAACRSCGHQNSIFQKFCGGCGVALQEQDSRKLVAEDLPADTVQNQLPLPGEDQELSHFLSEHGVESWSLTTGNSSPPWHARESSSSSLDGGFSPSFSYSYSSSPGYRFYIGVALALLIAGLVYVGWRSGLTTTGDTRITPSPETAKTDAADRTRPPSDPPAKQPDREDPVTDKAATTPAESTPSLPATTPALKTPPADQPTRAPQPPPTAAPEPPNQRAETPTPTVPGSQEVVIAENYMKGTNGQQRDSQEAVRWLWRAVAKRNPEATLQLADLYLEGDGIPKNCEQARVLLRVAASKGSKSAADRLRHLQAFGCE